MGPRDRVASGYGISRGTSGPSKGGRRRSGDRGSCCWTDGARGEGPLAQGPWTASGSVGPRWCKANEDTGQDGLTLDRSQRPERVLSHSWRRHFMSINDLSIGYLNVYSTFASDQQSVPLHPSAKFSTPHWQRIANQA